ncbi:hypothetical protein THC_0048 [Caldimicrobium thiodismutans]|uniref:Lipoprotein SmpA/OmlA domain-containing protein n=1 Tax=Caldimicrobium thiodismutans TaxID=1653476 RepID=A0A0U5AEM4_9BACT|nr:outer membrane protein assembly factor BamE [Caldimicrobium thiodismutans]BAU22455.1 hypothetical protein THC_0048 [Caldimicrobium thiodismutans]
MQKFLYLILSIFIFSACSTTPGPNLASKASLIHKEVSTKAEVLAYLGPPVQAFVRPDKKEEWYYYYRVKNFWENFPIVKGYKGEDYTEVLKIVFEGEKVVEVIYYTLVNPEKQKR